MARGPSEPRGTVADGRPHSRRRAGLRARSSPATACCSRTAIPTQKSRVARGDNLLTQPARSAAASEAGRRGDGVGPVRRRARRDARASGARLPVARLDHHGRAARCRSVRHPDSPSEPARHRHRRWRCSPCSRSATSGAAASSSRSSRSRAEPRRSPPAVSTNASRSPRPTSSGSSATPSTTWRTGSSSCRRTSGRRSARPSSDALPSASFTTSRIRFRTSATAAS